VIPKKRKPGRWRLILDPEGTSVIDQRTVFVSYIFEDHKWPKLTRVRPIEMSSTPQRQVPTGYEIALKRLIDGTLPLGD